MIWDTSGATSECRSVVVTYIADEINGICGKDVLLRTSDAEEVARAVEDYLELRGAPEGEPRFLMVLAARALSAVGAGDAARRVYLFGSGLVSPSEWEITGGDAVWTVDLLGMSVNAESAHEMLLLVSLHIIIDAMAGVWDATEGKGTLGLRHVCATARVLSGGNGRGASSSATEIRDWCRAKLGQLAQSRGWTQTPQVINLDG
jgi:hypothetical protein